MHVYLIIGLGNPGEEYKGTRHNVGYMVVEQIFNFQTNKPLPSEIARIIINDNEVIMVKPLAYMNNSGFAVKKLYTKYHILNTNRLIVVHDDITLELGSIKISKGVGAGNHNGVQSIIDALGTKDFIRVRCGIGRGTGTLTDVVLSKFTHVEHEIADQMIRQAAEACRMIVADGVDHARVYQK